MRISIFPPQSIHEIGQRPNQEDSIAQWNNRLFVLCDGMGGHEKGEVASHTVCQSLVKWFGDNIKDDSFTDDQLCEALEYAYTELDKFDDGSPRKMGTTLTLLYFHNKGATAAHIGDSRVYHIRPSWLDKSILYQSRDHSLAFDLFQAGEISYEEMQNFTQKNVITRAMTPGLENRHRADVIHVTDIQPGDYFYLCSDGMLELMDRDNHSLQAIFVSHAPDTLKRDHLLSETSNNHDNHSAWIIHVENVVKEDGDEEFENEEPTSRCNAINIIPANNVESDVQMADSDDVKIVFSPPIPTNKRFPFIKAVIAGLLFLAVLAVATILLFKKNDKEKLQRPQPMMQIPIQRHILKDSTKDTTITDSNKQRNNEPTGNQQPVNAPRGNDSPRDIQNR